MTDQSSRGRRLSVAMIVRDAEDCLAATLDSVASVADEIVVLDTGSQDATIRIARQKATVVASAAWTDDFSAARNAALQTTSGDWVLWLDAGETLPPSTCESLRRFIDQEADEQAAYWLIIRTPAQGANIAGEQAARIRLHPRRDGLAFSGRVRETLQDSLHQLGMRIESLPLVIDRGPREHDEALRRRRAERNRRLAQFEIDESGPSANLLNCLGEAEQALGNAEKSLEWHGQALQNAAPASSDMLEAFYGLLTALEGTDQQRDAQLSLCMKALEIFPLDAQLLCAVGGYLQTRHQFELASRAYALAAQHGQVTPEIWHLQGLREIAISCQAVTLELLQREDEAVQLLEQETAADPDALRLRRQLVALRDRSQGTGVRRQETALSPGFSGRGI